MVDVPRAFVINEAAASLRCQTSLALHVGGCQAMLFDRKFGRISMRQKRRR